jgi:hypothetical protein
MPRAVKAVYENGVLKLQEPIALAEHAEVKVLILGQGQGQQGAGEGVDWGAWRPLIGSIRGGPDDVSERHDDYLDRSD